jgi:hypothetical protein
MRGKYQLVLLALFAMTLLILPTAARAGTNLGMQTSSGATTNTLCDNDINFAGCTFNTNDANATLGAVTYVGGIGGWNVVVATGAAAPVLSMPELMDLNSITVSTNGSATPLTLTLTLTGLTTPLGNLPLFNSIGGTSSGNVGITINGWLSQTNTAFCTSGACGTNFFTQSFNLTGTGTPFSGTKGGFATSGSGPYSLTLQITVDGHGSPATVSFDDELFVPEPATLSVLGAGLLALGTGLRKKLLRA